MGGYPNPRSGRGVAPPPPPSLAGLGYPIPSRSRQGGGGNWKKQHVLAIYIFNNFTMHMFCALQNAQHRFRNRNTCISVTKSILEVKTRKQVTLFHTSYILLSCVDSTKYKTRFQRFCFCKTCIFKNKAVINKHL